MGQRTTIAYIQYSVDTPYILTDFGVFSFLKKKKTIDSALNSIL